MRVNSLFGLLAGATLLGVVPGEAAADLRTNASGRWQYVSALGAEYGRLVGQPAMLLQSGSTLASLVGAPSLVTTSKGEEEDGDEEKGGFLSSAYVIVLAGVGGGAYLASELIGGGSPGSVGDPNSPPAAGGPTTPTTPTNPTDPTGGTGGPSTSPAPTTPTPETTTPEPVTMTLLATGLAGLGGAQIRRRRKSTDNPA
jgi:hypothetical protein